MAEIGVGADIAAGSQEDRGNWAPLVKAQKVKINIKKQVGLLNKNGENSLKQNEEAKNTKAKTSPNRLKKKVTIEL